MFTRQFCCVDLFEETDTNGSPGTDVNRSGGEEESVDPQVSPNADPTSLSDKLLSHGLDPDIFSENSENEDSTWSITKSTQPTTPTRQSLQVEKLCSSPRPIVPCRPTRGFGLLGRGVM